MANYSEELIDEVWDKGRTVEGCDPAEYRLDAAGALMIRSHRGSDDDYDWEIDHVYPKTKLEHDGIPDAQWDVVDNLRPFNAKNNLRKSDDYPSYHRALVYDKFAHKNKQSEIQMTVNTSVQVAVKKAFNLDLEIVHAEPSDD